MSQIMKKAILTFGLFSMIMVLTSFTAPQEIGGNQGAPKNNGGLNPVKFEIGGTQGAPKSGGLSPITFEIGGNQGAPKNNGGLNPVKYEIGGNQGAPRNKGMQV